MRRNKLCRLAAGMLAAILLLTALPFAQATGAASSQGSSAPAASEAAIAQAENREAVLVHVTLYDDGWLVFQQGDGAEEGKTVLSSWEYDLNQTEGRPPWFQQVGKIQVVQFKDKISPASTAFWFQNSRLERIEQIENLDTSNVTTMDYMFQNCFFLKEIDLSHFDTSKVTTMHDLFNGCTSLRELDCSSFDTSNVTDMSFFASRSNLLESVNLTSFDTSKVTNMRQMFARSPSMKELDLSSFDTRNVKNMIRMFRELTDLTKIYVSENFVVSPDTDTTDMFISCGALTGGRGTAYDPNHMTGEYACIDNPPEAPGYFTSKAEPVRALVEVDELSKGFVAADPAAAAAGETVTLKATPPEGCEAETLSVTWSGGEIPAEPGTEDSWTFQMPEGEVLVRVSLKAEAALPTVTVAESVHGSVQASRTAAAEGDPVRLFVTPDDGFYLSDLTVSTDGGEVDLNRETLSFSSFTMPGEAVTVSAAFAPYTEEDFYAVLYADGVFSFQKGSVPKAAEKTVVETFPVKLDGYYYITDYAAPDVPWYPYRAAIDKVEFADDIQPISTAYWFYRHNVTELLGMEHLDTSELRDMASMFQYNYKLEAADFSAHPAEKLTDLSDLFMDCYSLSSIDISTFRTSNVTSLQRLFMDCVKLKELDLSRFDTASVTTMSFMFYSAASLKTVYVSPAFVTTKVARPEPGMFLNCAMLMGGKGSRISGPDSITDTRGAHIDQGPEYPGYFTLKAEEGTQFKYLVQIAEPADEDGAVVEGGTVTANVTEALPGDTVTLTAAPEKGYQLSKLTVSFGEETINPTAGDGGTCTFTMPDGAVTARPEWAEAPDSGTEPGTDPGTEPGAEPAKHGCFVATSVYGSYDCPEVWTLRRYRDEVLGSTWYGRQFIKAYYAASPAAVQLFGDCDWFRNFFRARLDTMVDALRADGFASTPYQDRDW